MRYYSDLVDDGNGNLVEVWVEDNSDEIRAQEDLKAQLHRFQHGEQIESDYLCDASLKLLEVTNELTEAKETIKNLQWELTKQRDNNHERNVELDALHYVWCDGGCKSGTHRFTEQTITEEVVLAAERNTKRLRRWYDAAQRKGNI